MAHKADMSRVRVAGISTERRLWTLGNLKGMPGDTAQG